VPTGNGLGQRSQLPRIEAPPAGIDILAEPPGSGKEIGLRREAYGASPPDTRLPGHGLGSRIRNPSGRILVEQDTFAMGSAT
jgi:hypothetical protein